METTLVLRAIFALAIVLGLVALCAWIARRWPALLQKAQRSGAPRRLIIVERLPIDSRRQILVVREGRREHVILLGVSSEQIIESRDFVRSVPRPGDGGTPISLRPTPIK